MRTVTLIAVIAMAIQIVASFYYLLLDFKVIEYSQPVGKIMQPLFFLSNVGLLIFFIQLYQKQSKN